MCESAGKVYAAWRALTHRAFSLSPLPAHSFGVAQSEAPVPEASHPAAPRSRIPWKPRAHQSIVSSTERAQSARSFSPSLCGRSRRRSCSPFLRSRLHPTRPRIAIVCRAQAQFPCGSPRRRTALIRSADAHSLLRNESISRPPPTPGEMSVLILYTKIAVAQ